MHFPDESQLGNKGYLHHSANPTETSIKKLSTLDQNPIKHPNESM